MSVNANAATSIARTKDALADMETNAAIESFSTPKRYGKDGRFAGSVNNQLLN
jgi:hypothetical protein